MAEVFKRAKLQEYSTQELMQFADSLSERASKLTAMSRAYNDELGVVLDSQGLAGTGPLVAGRDTATEMANEAAKEATIIAIELRLRRE